MKHFTEFTVNETLKIDDIPKIEAAVLLATRSLRNTYAGKKNIRYTEASEVIDITPAEWEAAKSSLIEQGLLQRNGVITKAGTNVAPYPLTLDWLEGK